MGQVVLYNRRYYIGLLGWVKVRGEETLAQLLIVASRRDSREVKNLRPDPPTDMLYEMC